MELNGKKVRSPQKVLKNLLLLREELARYRYSYELRQVVAKIDTCLHGNFKLREVDDDANEKG